MAYKILFADDSRMINEVMTFAFENNDFEIETCLEQKQIEKKIQTKAFDIIIISQLLDGINFALEIRKSKLNKNTQLFIISKQADINLKKQAKQNKVDGWIIKPFIPEKLVKTLKFHLIKLHRNKK